jgi:hypothetical protein
VIVNSAEAITHSTREAGPLVFPGLRWATGATAALLGIWTCLVLWNGWLESRYFDGVLADGPFQLLNALRRIQAGQRPGADFPFFHGAGIPWMHYVPFALLGGNLAASELTRQWLTPLAFLGSTALFGWVACGGLSGSLWFTALAAFSAFPLGLPEMYTPAASLIGMRSTTSVLLFALLMSNLSRVWKASAGALIFGISLTAGTEQGMYLGAALFLTLLVALVVHRRLGAVRAEAVGVDPPVLGAILAGGIVLFPVLLAIMCGPRGVGPALRFAFSELPADQFWFHGAPPNAFMASLYSLRAIKERAAVVILIGLVWWLFTIRDLLRGRKDSGVRLLMLSAGLFACASYTGMLSARYYLPLGRVIVFCAAAQLMRRTGLRPVQTLAAWGLLALVPGFWGPASSLLDALHRPAEFAGGREVSGSLLSPTLSAYITSIESVTGPLVPGNPPLSLWSTYAGLPEAAAGVLLPKEDYLIHALGPERRARYISTFLNLAPEFVQTMRPDKLEWEEMLRGEDWPFYEQVLKNYDIATVTPFTLVWRRNGAPGASPGPAVALEAGDGQQPILLPQIDPRSNPALYVVEVRYRIESRLRKIPLAGSLPRYLIEIEGAVNHTPISLSPYYASMRFPVLPKTGSRARLIPRTRSVVPGASFILEKATVQLLPLDNRQKDFLVRGLDFWLPY